MKTINQLIARLSIFCYLVVVSIAAAHALPMASAAGGMDAVMVMTNASGDKQVPTVEEMAPTDEKQPDCHESNIASADVSSMSMCKIFCSATAHAFISGGEVNLLSIAPPVQVASMSDDLLTRQLSVEQHPPR